MLTRRDDGDAPRHDKVGILERLELLQRIASDSDEIRRSACDQLPEGCQPEMFPGTCCRGRQHVERSEQPTAGLEHKDQFMRVDSPGDIGMGEIGAVEQPYACLDELVGILSRTRAAGLCIERTDDPHARGRSAGDQVVRK